MSPVHQLVVDFLLWCCSCPPPPPSLLLYPPFIVIFGVSVYLFKVTLDLRQVAMNARKLHIRVGDEMLCRYHRRVDRIEMLNPFIDDLVKCLCVDKTCEHSAPNVLVCHSTEWTLYDFHFYRAWRGQVKKVDANLRQRLQEGMQRRQEERQKSVLLGL